MVSERTSARCQNENRRSDNASDVAHLMQCTLILEGLSRIHTDNYARRDIYFPVTPVTFI